MNKNLLKIFLCGIILLGITGCTKENKDDANELNNSNMNKYRSVEWKCDIPLTDIKDFSEFDSKFITNDGELYEYSLTQLFSNEKYCKKIDSTMKFTRFLNGAIETDKKHLYAYYNNKFIENMVGWTGGYDYEIYRKYPSSFLFSKSYSGGIYDSNHDYALVKKGIVYNIKSKLNNNYDLIEIGHLSSDEEYVSSHYQVIKTTKNYYNYAIINKDKCDKYADVECEYGLSKIDDISDIYDDIYYFNGAKIIFKDDLKNIYFYND